MLTIIWIALFSPVRGDFVYPDFNETTGLVFLGDAGTTDCVPYEPNILSGDVHGKADVRREASDAERGEKTDLIFESTMDTNNEEDNADINLQLAGFLHRSDLNISAPDKTRCATRVRLTPSGPSKVGGMWFRDKVPVLTGFETTFQFQISDHSKECTLHRDQYFSQISHRTCSVRGADGFALVIHSDERGLDAIGNNCDLVEGNVPLAATGGQLGFGGPCGIRNGLAIAFDTWQNQGYDYVGVDHVKILSRGVELPNDALDGEAVLGFPRASKLADGAKHKCRVEYYTEVVKTPSEYLDFLVASDSLAKYLKDNGEQKRVGVLVVFMDDGITDNTPMMAMPINLSLLINLPDDKAYVGFTSSTGRFYEKHDILAWHFCDQRPCDQGKKEIFDYHQESASFPDGLRMYGQGEGYGGDRNSLAFPLEHTFGLGFDTSPLQEDVAHFANARNDKGHWLADDASAQVPPNTIF